MGTWREASAALLGWVRFFRPEFWVVSVFPAWVGWALATRQIAPGPLPLGHVPAPADAAAWASDHWRALLALVTLGPFLGGSIMVTNDYHDRQVDVFNPKKAQSPLVLGTATAARARFWMIALTAATLVSGFLLSPLFGLLLAVGLVMSFLYSAPPVRLKARPLGDVLINAVGYGGVTTLAGWSLGGGWSQPLPLGALLIVMLAIAAGYIPTVMMDQETDRRSGLRTTAVSLGLRASWLLGYEALIAANLAMAGLALMGRYVTPAFLAFQAPFFVVEALAYGLLVSRDEPPRMFLGGSIVTLAFFGNLGAFLLAYTGRLVG